MGFLDQSTNGVILDCVLTDRGRQLLARNDGSFSVVKFAVSDDEVDYSIIRKYGRTVGIEKIEKNTPIFEALTNQSLAMKYKLVSVSNPNLIRLPDFSISGEGVDTTNRIVSIGNTTIKRRTITVFQTVTNETSIDVELRDQAFVVDMDNKFLQIIGGGAPDNIDNYQRASYILTRDAGETSLGGSKLTFTLGTKSIPESNFTIYGSSSNKNLITTFVKVYGVQSGASMDLEIQIQKTN